MLHDIVSRSFNNGSTEHGSKLCSRVSATTLNGGNGVLVFKVKNICANIQNYKSFKYTTLHKFKMAFHNTYISTF